VKKTGGCRAVLAPAIGGFALKKQSLLTSHSGVQDKQLASPKQPAMKYAAKAGLSSDRKFPLTNI
jgi:hypothetical protein